MASFELIAAGRDANLYSPNWSLPGTNVGFHSPSLIIPYNPTSRAPPLFPINKTALLIQLIFHLQPVFSLFTSLRPFGCDVLSADPFGRGQNKAFHTGEEVSICWHATVGLTLRFSLLLMLALRSLGWFTY